MQSMVVLIDTNILLNYLTNREDDYLEHSIRIVEMCAKGECIGYIAFHTLSTLWYVLRKRSDNERRENLINNANSFIQKFSQNIFEKRIIDFFGDL